MTKIHCTAMTKTTRRPCKAWAVGGTKPPRCASHGGVSASPGAPEGNKNAQTHGLYSTPNIQVRDIDDAIQLLSSHLEELAEFITTNDKLTIEDMARLSAVLGQNVSRYARLLKAQRELTGERDERIMRDVEEALALAGQKLGVELSTDVFP